MGGRRSKASSPTPPRSTTLGGFFSKGRVEPKQGAASENLDCLVERLGRKSQSNCSLCYKFALAQCFITMWAPYLSMDLRPPSRQHQWEFIATLSFQLSPWEVTEQTVGPKGCRDASELKSGRHSVKGSCKVVHTAGLGSCSLAQCLPLPACAHPEAISKDQHGWDQPDLQAVYSYGHGPCLARVWLFPHFIYYYMAAAKSSGSGGDL